MPLGSRRKDNTLSLDIPIYVSSTIEKLLIFELIQVDVSIRFGMHDLSLGYGINLGGGTKI